MDKNKLLLLYLLLPLAGAAIYIVKDPLSALLPGGKSFLSGIFTAADSTWDTTNSAEVASSAGKSSDNAAVPRESCPFETSQAPDRNSVIINEIAWMGTTKKATNEWIELKNISSETLALGGWQLLDQGGKIKIIFGSSAKITAGDFYLLGKEKSIDGKTEADFVYRGALKNAGDSLKLFDRDCRLMDEVVSADSWLAGDNITKKTMERDSGLLTWHTSALAGGTPRKENTRASTPAFSNVPAGAPQKSVIQITDSPPSSVRADPLLGGGGLLPIKSNVHHIVISQVQITGGVGKTANDFVELYNPTGKAFSLKGYRLVKRIQAGAADTLIKSWTSDALIPAYGYYLWANATSTLALTPDAFTSQTLADNNGIAIRLGPNDTGTVMDSVAWGKAQNAFVEGAVFPTNPGMNQAILRKSWQDTCIAASLNADLGNGCDRDTNAADFELIPNSRPRNSRSR